MRCEHEIEALPGGRVAVALDHLPIEDAGLVGALDLAQGPAGVVGGVDDVAVVGHVLDVLDVVLGHLEVVVGFGKGLVDCPVMRDKTEGIWDEVPES